MHLTQSLIDDSFLFSVGISDTQNIATKNEIIYGKTNSITKHKNIIVISDILFQICKFNFIVIFHFVKVFLNLRKQKF